MNDFTEWIAATRLVDQVDSVISTGDLGYEGTALEVSGVDGNELFYVVVDPSGQLQILFLRSDENYRIPLHLMERVIDAAKQKIRRIG